MQARRDLEQCRRRLLDAQVRSRGDSSLQDEGNGAVAAAKGNALRAAKEELKMASSSPKPVSITYNVAYYIFSSVLSSLSQRGTVHVLPAIPYICTVQCT